MPSELSYEETADVGVITLQRPEARNALTFTTYRELEDAVRSTTARCLVITGADPAFCSGDDVKQVMTAVRDSNAAGLAADPQLTPAADPLLHTDVPIVAAVNGAAVGWGMELALMADLRVASDRARFGELFVLRGLCCDVAGIGRLAQLVGREPARAQQRSSRSALPGSWGASARARGVGLSAPSRPTGMWRRGEGQRSRMDCHTP